MTAALIICRLDELEEGSAIQDALEKMTGQRSVPNIFISAFLSIFAYCLILTYHILFRR